MYISSRSKVTPSGRVPVFAPGVLAGKVAWLTDLVTLGEATYKDAWEEVASGLEELSALEGNGAPGATDAGLFREGLPGA